MVNPISAVRRFRVHKDPVIAEDEVAELGLYAVSRWAVLLTIKSEHGCIL